MGNAAALSITRAGEPAADVPGAGRVMQMPRTRILVIDDEPQIHRFLRPALTAAGFQVEQAETAAEGMRVIRGRLAEAVLLDLGLPDMDGAEALARIRQFSDVPVLVVSARDREADKVAALEGGADDYIEKPFGIAEMVARIRLALRHRTPFATSDIVRFPGLTVDLAHRRADVGDGPVQFTPREWTLLVSFVKNAGRVLTHRQLLIAVWGQAHVEDRQYLRVYMGNLRQKLGPAAALISTENGVGYRMADPIRAEG
jgi:two-component system KDP operon response regulator KdpE